MAQRKKDKKTKVAKKKTVEKVKIFISASFNNTLVTVTDESGNTLTWGSAGKAGFKGTKKSTPYAATSAVEKVLAEAKERFDIKEAEIYLKGPGAGRDASLRAIRASGIKISLIADVTPIPHNGPRPKKKRRL